MKRLALTLTLVLLASPAFAQSADASKVSPDTENGRFTMSPVEGGVMRLDTRTGQVSICRKKNDNWTCEAAADDRAAYEKEIARLQEKITNLEKGGGKSEELKLPSDADVDRVMTFFESIMRRFKTIIDNLQREDNAKRT